MEHLTEKDGFQVAALYRFCPLDELESIKVRLHGFCLARGIRGTLLLAEEGINGTVAGSKEAIAELVNELGEVVGLTDENVKFSSANAMPFYRLKVRIKREIVTMGVEGINAARDAGTYVAPDAWNGLIDDPNTIVIDTRNDYEVALGRFAGAEDPLTKSFREFPQWAQTHRKELEGKKIAMYCTGGIRCEKATAYVKSLGFDDVFHLQGGILKYLEEIDPSQSRWQGECFVFDERVSLKHGLQEGHARLCRACRYPLTDDELASDDYVEGISCPHCIDEKSAADRARYQQRQTQIEKGLRIGGEQRHV